MRAKNDHKNSSLTTNSGRRRPISHPLFLLQTAWSRRQSISQPSAKDSARSSPRLYAPRPSGTNSENSWRLLARCPFNERGIGSREDRELGVGVVEAWIGGWFSSRLLAQPRHSIPSPLCKSDYGTLWTTKAPGLIVVSCIQTLLVIHSPFSESTPKTFCF